MTSCEPLGAFWRLAWRTEARGGAQEKLMKTLLTRRQALTAMSAFALAPLAANAAEQVGMQLILAADVSGSVSPARYRTQQDGYIEALGDPRVLKVISDLDPPVLAITFIAWSREQAVMVPWMRVHDARSMDQFRERLRSEQRPRVGINTLISQALLFCDARFDKEFTGGRKVIDVSGAAAGAARCARILQRASCPAHAGSCWGHGGRGAGRRPRSGRGTR